MSEGKPGTFAEAVVESTSRIVNEILGNCQIQWQIVVVTNKGANKIIKEQWIAPDKPWNIFYCSGHPLDTIEKMSVSIVREWETEINARDSAMTLTWRKGCGTNDLEDKHLMVGCRALGRKEMFYLTTHSTHFIYGYMASDIWLRTILIVTKETRCRHIGYSLRLTARVLLYAPSHRQDST